MPSEIFRGFSLADKHCLIKMLQTPWGGAFVPGEKKGASCPILSKWRDRICHRRLRTFALNSTGAIHRLHGLRARAPLRDGVRKRVPKAIRCGLVTCPGHGGSLATAPRLPAPAFFLPFGLIKLVKRSADNRSNPAGGDELCPSRGQALHRLLPIMSPPAILLERRGYPRTLGRTPSEV